MKKNLLILTVLLIFAFFSCKKNSEVGAAGEYRVDPVFEPYVQDFIAEGAKRGKTIDFSQSGLIVEFSDRIVNNASGFCYVGQHHIVIDKAEWYALSEDVRGFLLFHELGHCELDRNHTNVKFENTTWKSIMRGSPLEGLEVWIPVPYFGFRKDYYIDELFNEQTTAPTWASQKFDIKEVSDSQKELVLEKDSLNRITQQTSNINGDYEIEIKFKLNNTRPNRSTLTWGTTNHHYYIQFFPTVGFNVSGYFIGVHKNSLDNGLLYSKNTENINGAELSKITIRREGSFEKVFFNDTFIFHIDALPNDLQSIRFDETNNNMQISSEFEIQHFTIKKIN